MRFVRGFFALIVLLAGLVGIPLALLALGGNPLPARLTGAAVLRALFRPDDGTVLIGLITIVGWIAWLVFALSVLTEMVAVLSRQRIRIPLPGLDGVQRGVGVLVVLVVAMVILPHPNAQAHGPSAPPTSGSTRSAPATSGSGAGLARASRAPTSSAAPSGSSMRSPGTAGSVSSASSAGRSARDRVAAQAHSPAVIHVVEPGDELWTLAEHYYGHGREWRRIAEANPRLLTGGPDRLSVGWRLAIPSADQHRPTDSAGRAGPASVHVQHGETLSSIADREYGDARAWPGILEANRATIADPDVIVVGEQVDLPPRVRTESGVFTRVGHVDPDHAGSKHADPDHAGSKHADPDHAGSKHADPDHAESEHADPDRAESKHGKNRVGSSRNEAAAGSGPRTSGPTRPEAAPEQSAARSSAGAGQPSAGQPPAGQPPAGQQSQAPASATEEVAEPIVLAGVGGLLAAGLIGGLAGRRRIQLQNRPVGRRIAHAGEPAQLTEARLGRRQTPLGLKTLDLALRAVGLHCRQSGQPLPVLQAARVANDEIELIFTAVPPDTSPETPEPPIGFRTAGSRWLLDAADAGYLAKLSGIDAAAQPYPGLAPVGVDLDGVQLLVNLEVAGVLSLEDGWASSESTSTSTSDILRAMATALAFSPWADEVVVSVVGGDRRLIESVGKHSVTHSQDLDRLLDRWEQRAATQRRHLDDGLALNHRIDPDLADPWVPEIALIDVSLSSTQLDRLQRLVLAQPPVTMAAVVRCPTSSDWRLRAASGVPAPGVPASGVSAREGQGSDETALAHLEPLGWTFEPQQLSAEIGESIRDLIEASGSETTTPAPWWTEEPSSAEESRSTTLPAASVRDIPNPGPDAAVVVPAASEPAPCEPARFGLDSPAPGGSEFDPGPSGPIAPRRGWPTSPVSTAAFTDPANNVTFIGTSAGRRVTSEESATVAHPTAAGPNPVRHPTVQLLGPIELLGAAGPIPPRAGKQCIEYCTWLLEHPGRSAREMANALVVAEGTRRSNMSRLRAWLGTDDDGTSYLPDAYSGRIMLAPVVSSDWHRLQIMTGTGVNATSMEGLYAALSLVRGAPLADAAPGQWHWAEEMRTDMVSVIRDIGVELSSRALADRDLELARWATARSLTAAPHDERVLAMRIRIEHQAGRPAEVERLALQMSAHARLLGLDLDPETVDLLQQVMEGQLRARA